MSTDQILLSILYTYLAGIVAGFVWAGYVGVYEEYRTIWKKKDYNTDDDKKAYTFAIIFWPIFFVAVAVYYTFTAPVKLGALARKGILKFKASRTPKWVAPKVKLP